MTVVLTFYRKRDILYSYFIDTITFFFISIFVLFLYKQLVLCNLKQVYNRFKLQKSTQNVVKLVRHLLNSLYYVFVFKVIYQIVKNLFIKFLHLVIL